MTKDLVLCGSALSQDDKVSDSKILFLPQHTRARSVLFVVFHFCFKVSKTSACIVIPQRVMEKLAAKLNATISRYWNPSVTHVIASTNEKGACTRTLKVLMGILNGKWIINADCKLDCSLLFTITKHKSSSLNGSSLIVSTGMKASLEASQPVDEEQYEIHIDTQGCQDGPKTARLRAASNVSLSYQKKNKFNNVLLRYLTLYFLCQSRNQSSLTA